MNTINHGSPKSREAGFTLIEVLLYITIFSLIIGGIVGLGIAATVQRVQNQTRADLDYQGQAVMASITQAVRRADTVDSPTPGNSAATLTLTMNDSQINQTVFGTASRDGYDAVTITEGSSGSVEDLTNSRVTVSNLRFTNMAVGGTENSILVQFDLTYINNLGRPELDYSRSFTSGVTLP